MNYIDFEDDIELKQYLEIIDSFEPNEENVDMAEQMAVHIQGKNPEKLLSTLRPNEHPDIQRYRLEIYEPITKSHAKRVLNTISKIQKQSVYSVKIEEQKNVNEKETLDYYVNNMPFYGSLEKWLFDSSLEMDLIDPNAVCVVMPMEIPNTDTSYYKPMPYIFPSSMIVDEGYNYITILLEKKNIYLDEHNVKREGNIYMVVTDKAIKKITQIKRNEYQTEDLFKVEFNQKPYFRLAGDVIGGTFPINYESYISGILPYWNTAIRLDSDLNASYVLHMYPERVEMEVECKADGCTYNDKGKHVRYIDDKEYMCTDCNGSGWVTGRTPYGVTQVKKEDAMEDVQGTIFPGVTYIEKSTNIVELVQDRVDALIKSGYTSVNLDVLDSTAGNQSGYAKVIDRDAMNSFLIKVSNNIFDNILWNTIELISLWRFNEVVKFEIQKPVNFDYSSIENITNDIKNLRESKASKGVMALKEKELIQKSFIGNSAKMSYDMIDLDPMYGVTEEEKANIVLMKGVNKIDYIISSNIYSFVMRAYNEESEFSSMNRQEKVEIMKKYANEFIEEAKKEPKIEVQPDGQGG